MQEAKSGTPAEHFAEGRLAEVLLTRVKHKFLETALSDPRSDLRSDRLKHLKAELVQAKPLGGRLSPDMQDQLRQLEIDADALDAVSRAQSLLHEAHENADAYAELLRMQAPQESGSTDEADVAMSVGSGRPSQADAAKDQGVVLSERAAASGVVHVDAALERSRVRCLEREMQLDRQRENLVKEAMEMLRAWKSHSQVAYALCDALLSMAEVGGDEARQDMDRGGLGVLASTVADLHSDRCEVARCALRLLCSVSIELLVLTIEEQKHSSSIVGLGLEALNRRVKNDDAKLNEVAKYGGREMLDDLEVIWKGSKMLSLHILNLKRRLRRSTTKSIKKIFEVQLPPEDVVKLRETFDAVDEAHIGSIGKHQLGRALTMLRIQFSDDELEEAVAEVDLDGSGEIEWPEFLCLMEKFGSNFSIENKFSQERLQEMREVFTMFDQDNSGTLDVGELRDVMKSVGLAPQDSEIRTMIAEVDGDGSGTIDWANFLYLMSKTTVDAENQQRLAFEFFLAKGDRTNRIYKERFVSQMQRLTSEFSKEELEAMMVQAKCEDHDTSYITYREFVKMMMRG
jgi:Ca2+-binding EF-hand superfamily protein